MKDLFRGAAGAGPDPGPAGRALREGGLLLALLLPFFWWVYPHLLLDFWYDEVWSLVNYTFVPVRKTVTDYQVPNNHILFNLVNNLLVKLCGMKDIYTLMDRPYLVRAVSLLYSLAAIACLYLIGRRFFDRIVGLLSVILFTTTVPFYNYAAQVRGYSLSLMLVCLLLLFLWRYEQRRARIDAVLYILAISLALYTLPANLYLIATLMLFQGTCALLEMAGHRRMEGDRKRPKKGEDRRGERPTFWTRGVSGNLPLRTLLLSGLGVLLAVLFYMPVLDAMLHHPYTRSQGRFHTATLFMMPTVWWHLVSYRVLLIPIALTSVVAWGWIRAADSAVGRRWSLCLMLLVFPFLLSFVRGDNPPDRIFINLTPVASLFLATGIGWMGRRVWRAGPRRRMIGIGLVFLYCHGSFAYCMDRIDERLRSDIESGAKSQDLFFNYYLRHYHPRRLIQGFVARYGTGQVKPVLLEIDGNALPHYLHKYRFSWYRSQAMLPLLKSESRLFVISVHTPAFRNLMAAHPEFALERVNAEPDFHNIFLLTRIHRKNS